MSVKSNRCLFIDTFALYGRFRHFFSKLVRFFLALYGFWPLLEGVRYRKGDEEAEKADARKSKAVAEGSDSEQDS